MPPNSTPSSAEQLLSIARNYWRADKDYHSRTDISPEYERLCELWEQELKKKHDQWLDFLDDLERALPGFSIGDGTATPDASFRCVAYPVERGSPISPFSWVVVGCVSILAPVYIIYGVEFEPSSQERHNPKVSLEPLPPEMQQPASLIARKIETTFGVSKLPRELAETRIPLYVEPREPPNTTLFHALFTGEPESFP
jgi:hypothetical protein